jgi:hypothetical protein
MSSPEADDQFPRTLLTIPTQYQSAIPKTVSSQSPPSQTAMANKNQPLFDDTNNETQFRQRVMAAVSCYNGDPDDLSAWLENTGQFFAKEYIPDTHQVFALRFLLTEQALDIYNAHEDLIHNFNDLRKLLLHTAGKAPLRTLASLDTIFTLPPHISAPAANSTSFESHSNTTTPFSNTSITLTQSPDELTQNEYRKSIIAQFHDDKSLKFSGEHKQDVLKWIEKLDRKFELAEISDAKRFDYLPELLQKGALNWFLEHKSSLNRSWSDFAQQFKKVYDSPNRAQLAFQKLQNYHQSADQDVRSFCSVIRKLCKEYDPDMSKKMKVDFLLRTVNPMYRPEILKLKPTDADEFEQTAIDVENTFLTLKAYEANTSSTGNTTTSILPYGSNYSSQQQSPASNSNYQRRRNNFQSNRRPYSNTPSRQVPSSQTNSQGSQPSLNYNSPTSSQQQHLFAFTSTGSESSSPPSPQQQQQSIPPLMSLSPITTPPHQQHNAPVSSSTQSLICQLCNRQGHSARACPF